MQMCRVIAVYLAEQIIPNMWNALVKVELTQERKQTLVSFLESRLQFVLASGEGDIFQLFLINDKNK